MAERRNRSMTLLCPPWEGLPTPAPLHSFLPGALGPPAPRRPVTLQPGGAPKPSFRLCPGLAWPLGCLAWPLAAWLCSRVGPVSPYLSPVPRQVGIALHTWGRCRDGA